MADEWKNKITRRTNYLKAGGSFINTCVLDSLLAGFHRTYNINRHVMRLLNEDNLWKEVISLLQEEKYTDARRRCLEELNSDKKNLFGHVKDYLPLLATLECAKTAYGQNFPNDSAIYKEIPRILLMCGDVIVLGDCTDLTLILVHREVHNDRYKDCLITDFPFYVYDEKNRIFSVEFLLLGEDQHMTTCFHSSENRWYQFDNDPQKPSFEETKSPEISHIYLAVYVNRTQELEEKLSIAETGEGAGAKPFVSNSDEEMEIENSLSHPIPETDQHLGPTPFFETQPQMNSLPNMEQPGQDIEMVSCSSSDSDL